MSSRGVQGKYMEILFSRNQKIMGGKTTQYLLEKVRTAAQSPAVTGAPFHRHRTPTPELE